MKRKNLIWVGIVVLVAILVYLIFCSFFEFVPKNYPPQNQTIVAFGDSLIKGVGSTEGNDFVSLLSERIGRPIVNMGVPGETSADGLVRISDIVALGAQNTALGSQAPGIVIVLFGGNDYLKKVPQIETFSNLRKIVTELQSKGSMVVLLGIRGGLLNDRFDSDFARLAKDTKTIYVPDVLDGLLADSRYMSDAVHPNDVGYTKIADRVYKEMEKYLK